MEELMDEIMKTAVSSLREELERQGHIATKRLYDSHVAERIKKTGNGFRGEIYAESYWKRVNDGIPASEVRRNIMAHKFAILKWTRVKLRLQGDVALKKAIKITKLHAKQGVPTIGSRRMGKKTGYVDDAKENLREKIEEMIDAYFTENGISLFI